MKPDKLKRVGTLGGEPVYEILATDLAGNTAAKPRRIPITSPEDAEAAHRVTCLPCLIDSLIDPVEELEEFQANAVVRIREIDSLAYVAEGYDLLALSEEREELLCHLALASQSIATLQALIQTSAKLL